VIINCAVEVALPKVHVVKGDTVEELVKELTLHEMVVAHLPMSDVMEEDLSDFLPRSLNLIEASVKMGRGIFIHCKLGVSRSAAVCIAHHIVHHKMTRIQAFEHVKARRPCVAPNMSFQLQLDMLA
jgi:protein-tyrosine phosphatase